MKKLNLLYLTIAIIIPQLMHSKYCLISIPKCGTYLLADIVKEITHSKRVQGLNDWTALNENQIKQLGSDQYYETHAIANQHNINMIKKYNLKGIFIIRDPRDQAVSFAHYVSRYKKEWPTLANMNLSQRITQLINHGSSIYSEIGGWTNKFLLQINSIASFYELYKEWFNNPLIYVTRFEKIIGPKGGGNLQEQLNEIIAIGKHLGYTVTQQEAQRIASKTWGISGTFRQGLIGSWKQDFKPEHIALFKQKAGNLLIDLQYETSTLW